MCRIIGLLRLGITVRRRGIRIVLRMVRVLVAGLRMMRCRLERIIRVFRVLLCMRKRMLFGMRVRAWMAQSCMSRIVRARRVLGCCVMCVCGRWLWCGSLSFDSRQP